MDNLQSPQMYKGRVDFTVFRLNKVSIATSNRNAAWRHMAKLMLEVTFLNIIFESLQKLSVKVASKIEEFPSFFIQSLIGKVFGHAFKQFLTPCRDAFHLSHTVKRRM